MSTPAPPGLPVAAASPVAVRRLALGVLLGLALAWLAFEGASLAPRRLSPGAAPAVGGVPDAPGNGVRLSVFETARGRVWAPHLAQGLSPGFRDVVLRVAVVEHPDGVVLFGTGVAPGRAAPSVVSTVSNPFGHLRDVRSVLDEVPAEHLAGVVLPSLRWYHLGALDDVPDDVPVFATGSEVWAATDGPWPRRFAIDAERAAPVAERAARPPMRPFPLIGEPDRADLFGDGSVLVTGVRGTTFDELVMVVTDDSGAHTVLVGDSAWVYENVRDLAPRPPAAIWLHDRSWRSAARLIQVLHHVDINEGWTVVPLFDATVPIAEYAAESP